MNEIYDNFSDHAHNKVLRDLYLEEMRWSDSNKTNLQIFWKKKEFMTTLVITFLIKHFETYI